MSVIAGTIRSRASRFTLADGRRSGWRTIRKVGIRLDNADYIAGELGPLVGERVGIRRDAADPDRNIGINEQDRIPATQFVAQGPYQDPALDITIRETPDRPPLKANDDAFADMSPGEAMLADRSSLPFDWLTMEDESDAFANMRALSHFERARTATVAPLPPRGDPAADAVLRRAAADGGLDPARLGRQLKRAGPVARHARAVADTSPRYSRDRAGATRRWKLNNR